MFSWTVVLHIAINSIFAKSQLSRNLGRSCDVDLHFTGLPVARRHTTEARLALRAAFNGTKLAVGAVKTALIVWMAKAPDWAAYTLRAAHNRLRSGA